LEDNRYLARGWWQIGQQARDAIDFEAIDLTVVGPAKLKESVRWHLQALSPPASPETSADTKMYVWFVYNCINLHRLESLMKDDILLKNCNLLSLHRF